MWHYNRQWRNPETHKNTNLRPSYVCWDLLCIQVCGPFYKVLWAAEKKNAFFCVWVTCSISARPIWLLTLFNSIISLFSFCKDGEVCYLDTELWTLCSNPVCMCLLIGDLRSFLFRVINKWCLTYWFLFCCFGLHFLSLEFWVWDYSLCLLGCGSSLQT